MAHRYIGYNGKTSTEYGIFLSQNCVIHAPEPRIVTESVPFRDGSIDFSRAFGSLYYNARQLEYEFIVTYKNYSVQSRYAFIVNWLTNDGVGCTGDLYDSLLEGGYFTNATVTELGDPEFLDDKRHVFTMKVLFSADPRWVDSNGSTYL